MQIFGTVLVMIGIIYLYMIILRPPWVLNNFEVKIMIKKMGVKGFWIFFYVWTALILGAGIIILVYFV